MFRLLKSEYVAIILCSEQRQALTIRPRSPVEEPTLPKFNGLCRLGFSSEIMAKGCLMTQENSNFENSTHWVRINKVEMKSPRFIIYQLDIFSPKISDSQQIPKHNSLPTTLTHILSNGSFQEPRCLRGHLIPPPKNQAQRSQGSKSRRQMRPKIAWASPQSRQWYSWQRKAGSEQKERRETEVSWRGRLLVPNWPSRQRVSLRYLGRPMKYKSKKERIQLYS